MIIITTTTPMITITLLDVHAPDVNLRSVFLVAEQLGRGVGGASALGDAELLRARPVRRVNYPDGVAQTEIYKQRKVTLKQAVCCLLMIS